MDPSVSEKFQYLGLFLRRFVLLVKNAPVAPPMSTPRKKDNRI